MNEIHRVVGAAARRLFLIDFFRRLAVTLTAAIGLVLVTRLVQQTFGLELPWPIIAWSLAAATLVLTLLWTYLARARGVQVALAVDERANLREALSTAWCVERADDPWSRAVVEDAAAQARRVRVREVFPFHAPRLWPVPASAALLTMIVWMSVPPIDVLGLLASRQAEVKKAQEIVQVKAEVKAQEQRLEEALAKAGVEMKADLGGKLDELNQPTAIDPEQIRRAAVQKLTSVAEKLQDLQNSQKEQALDALRESMRQLRQPGPGPMENLAREMARGNFEKAADALQELKKEMELGKLTPEQQAQLEKQAENLSKQLSKLGEQNKRLEETLKQAGLDAKQAQQLAKQAAGDPQAAAEAIKKAMEQLKNLTPEQKQELMKQALSQCEAAGQCKNMGDKLGQMAQSMGQAGMSQDAQQAMQGVGDALSQMEQLQQESQGLEAALNEAKKQLAEMGGKCEGGDGDGAGKDRLSQYAQAIGQWREGESDGQGSGSGGPGQSGGGQSPEATPADFNLEKRKQQVANSGQGPIISQRLTWGEQVRGESQAQFSATMEAAAAEAAEDIENLQVPREFRDAVKTYFGLDKQPKKAADSKAAEPAKK